MTIGGRGVPFGVAAVLLIALSGCTDEVPSSARSEAAPRFSGPWSTEFSAAYQDSHSDYERAVLRDGAVTPSELEDAHSRVDQCLRDSGLTIFYDPDGGFRIGSTRGGSPSNDMRRTNSVLEACEAKYDRSITKLFEDTRRNPQKLDDATITVGCLRKNHLVDEQYTARQFRKDYDEDTLPFSSFDPGWKQCDLDPLGLWRTP